MAASCWSGWIRSSAVVLEVLTFHDNSGLQEMRVLSRPIRPCSRGGTLKPELSGIKAAVCCPSIGQFSIVSSKVGVLPTFSLLLTLLPWLSFPTSYTTLHYNLRLFRPSIQALNHHGCCSRLPSSLLREPPLGCVDSSFAWTSYCQVQVSWGDLLMFFVLHYRYPSCRVSSMVLLL